MVARFLASRRQPLAAAAALLLALAPWGLISPLQARLQDPPLPREQELRELQQLVFACGRENTSGPCEQARRRADPLLDHPRLPGSCKDVLWQIREQALVASANSLQRREQLERTGLDLVRVCQQRRAQPAAPRPGTGSPGPRPMFGPSQQP
jgi:hypothetical protein